MSITIQKMTNPQGRQFLFETSDFPLKQGQTETFYASNVIEENPGAGLSPEDAARKGYAAIHSLIKKPKLAGTKPRIGAAVASVTSTGQDMLTLTLNNGFKWDDMITGQTSQPFDKFLATQLEQHFIAAGRKLYNAPVVSDPEKVIAEVNALLERGMVANDAYSNVFETIKKDQGGIKATAYNPQDRSLTMAFSGKCESNCVTQDTSNTEAAITAYIWRNRPDVMRVLFRTP